MHYLLLNANVRYTSSVLYNHLKTKRDQFKAAVSTNSGKNQCRKSTPRRRNRQTHNQLVYSFHLLLRNYNNRNKVVFSPHFIFYKVSTAAALHLDAPVKQEEKYY